MESTLMIPENEPDQLKVLFFIFGCKDTPIQYRRYFLNDKAEYFLRMAYRDLTL